jgi:hypothetical protein
MLGFAIENQPLFCEARLDSLYSIKPTDLKNHGSAGVHSIKPRMTPNSKVVIGPGQDTLTLAA